jgi:biopolymer transport protein TolQ
MGEHLSIIGLIVQASVPVQIVIGILLLASLSSWAIIFGKNRVIGRVRREADRFESRFWSGDDLAQLYRAIESHGGATGMAGIFEFGFREFARLRQQGVTARCVSRSSRKSIASSRDLRRWRRWAAPARTWACSAPCGES